MKILSLKNIYNTLFETNLSEKEILAECKDKTKILEDMWKNSNQTDFSIYKHENYVYDMFICYRYFSRLSIYSFLKYFKEKILNYKNLACFDDYNGVGLTTLPILESNLNVSFFNDNENQISIFKKLCNIFNLKFPNNDKSSDIKYDIYISLEVIEHYKEPLSYFYERILQKTKIGSYLVYATTFNPFYLGHFNNYILNENLLFNNEIDFNKMRKLVNMHINNYFELIYKGYNQLPKIYKRKK